MRPVSASEPLPSSTVILLREEAAGGDPFSVLLLERHGSVAFPGAHAFPGGVVDPGDHDAPGTTLPVDQTWAPHGEGDGPDEALPYWVAAVREMFEEVGILLAVRDGRPLEGPLGDDLLTLRTRSHGGEAFPKLLAQFGLVPATDQLWYFARWITPPQNPRRFDTRFLVGRVPRGQDAIVDGTECVSCRWYTPREALSVSRRARSCCCRPPCARSTSCRPSPRSTRCSTTRGVASCARYVQRSGSRASCRR